MKKYIIYITLLLTTFFLGGCNSRTYDEISVFTPIPTVVKYTTDVKPIIQNSCVSCHSSTGSASFAPLTNYVETKNAIVKIINRIQRPDGDPQKMPVGGSLSSSQIETIKKWQTDGLIEN